MLARPAGSALHPDAHHQLSLVKYAEALALCYLVQLYKGHPEAGIGLVGAIQAHGLPVAHYRYISDFNAFFRGEQMPDQALKGCFDIGKFHKRHLTVDLGELRLAVGPQVFIAKALDKLKILIHARHHKQLLESLGRLRQGVKLTAVHARGHHKVAGPLRSRFDQHGGFHLNKTLLTQVFARMLEHTVAQ